MFLFVYFFEPRNFLVWDEIPSTVFIPVFLEKIKSLLGLHEQTNENNNCRVTNNTECHIC